MLQVEGGDGLDAVPIGVVSDAVAAKSLDNVCAATMFNNTRFFTDDFEGCLDAQGGEVVGDAEGGIVGDGIDVIFCVKPKDNVGGGLGERRAGGQQEEANACEKDLEHEI